LELAADSRYSLALDLAATVPTMAVVDVRGRIHARRSLEMPPRGAGVVEAVADAAADMLGSVGLGAGSISGLGISTPGLVDQASGVVVKSVRLGWYQVPLRAMLQPRFQWPVHIGKDTHVALLGEQWYGAGRNVQNLIYVWIGAGIAVAILVDGREYGGRSGKAGEFGHTLIRDDGPECACGNRGCIESLAGLDAISRRMASLSTEETGACAQTESCRTGCPTPDPMKVLSAAEAGDPVAVRVVREAGTSLGVGLANLINLFDPECIILGGQIRAEDRTYVTAAIETARTLSLAEIEATVSIAVSRLGSDAGLLGGAALVWRESFRST
jgi:glucokinase